VGHGSVNKAGKIRRSLAGVHREKVTRRAVNSRIFARNERFRRQNQLNRSSVIQRIQSLYLIMAIVVNGLFFFTPLFYRALADPAAWISSGLFSALFLSAAVSLYSLFRFRNRPLQIRWIHRAMIFQVLGVGFGSGVLFTLGSLGRYEWRGILSLGLLLLVWIMQVLAVRAIDRDEKLVKSMDRIR